MDSLFSIIDFSMYNISQHNVLDSIIALRRSKAQEDKIQFQELSWNSGKEAVKYISVRHFIILYRN